MLNMVPNTHSVVLVDKNFKKNRDMFFFWLSEKQQW